MDNYSREYLAIKVGQRLAADHVVGALEELNRDRQLPLSIRVDNDPEFTCRYLNLRAYTNGVNMDFSRPGKAY